MKYTLKEVGGKKFGSKINF